MQSDRSGSPKGGRYGPGASEFGFEDLDAYQAAVRLRASIYRAVKRLPPEERHALSSQMRRAAVSLTANIAEGYGRHHWQENIQYCRQSRGSLMELVDALALCREQGYVADVEYQRLRAEAARVLRLLNGYIAYLKRRKQE